LHRDPDEERYAQQTLGWEYPVEGKVSFEKKGERNSRVCRELF
jgi:hypothetical protein